MRLLLRFHTFNHFIQKGAITRLENMYLLTIAMRTEISKFTAQHSDQLTWGCCSTAQRKREACLFQTRNGKRYSRGCKWSDHSSNAIGALRSSICCCKKQTLLSWVTIKLTQGCDFFWQQNPFVKKKKNRRWNASLASKMKQERYNQTYVMTSTRKRRKRYEPVVYGVKKQVDKPGERGLVHGVNIW